MNLDVPIDIDPEFLRWIESQKQPRMGEAQFLYEMEEMTRQMRQVQGRLSSFAPDQRAQVLRQAATAVRVDVAVAEAKAKAMRKHRIDPTLPELVQALQQDEAARLDALEKERRFRVIKEVHKITLVRKAEIQAVYDRMMESSGIPPDVALLSLRVYDTYKNDKRYLQFFAGRESKDWWNRFLSKL